MSDDKIDYTPRPGRGKTKPAPPEPAPRQRARKEPVVDYAPRPARRESRLSQSTAYSPRPARKAKKGSTTRRSQGIKLGSLVRNRTFMVVVGIVGLLVLVVVPVLAELLQARPVGPVEQGNAYYDAGANRAQQGDAVGAATYFERAAAYYEQALLQEPDNVEVRTDLGTMYFYIGRLRGDTASVQKAVETWVTVLQYDPNKLEALFNLGQGYAELGQMDQAVAVWQRVIQLSPGSDMAQNAESLIQQYSVQPTLAPIP